MRLVLHPGDYTTKISVETMNGLTDAPAFIDKAIKQSGKQYTRLLADCGLNHALVYSFRKGKSSSIAVFLRLLDGLGYNIYIVKRKNHDL